VGYDELKNDATLHALVVDDDDVDRERLSRLLKRSGRKIEIQEVGSKQAALVELDVERNKYTFVFLDFNLEDGDGRELLPHIWDSMGRDCVVIAVTGQGTERAAAEAIKLGIKDYLSKRDLNLESVAHAVEDGLHWIESTRRARKAEEELIYRSLHDPLTQLYNRHVFFDRLEHLCAQHRRDASSFALLLMDLDRFKQVNDELGHDIGDIVLIEISRRLQAQLRAVDTVARMGGDEFGLLLPGIHSEEVACQLGQKIIDALEQPISVGSGVVNVGSSIGVALCSEQGVDSHLLLNHADRAMYQAKRGLMKVQVYQGMNGAEEIFHDRLTLLSEVEPALRTGEIQWYWQPKVHLPTRNIVGFEALVRWHHPRQGLIPTEPFVKTLEDSKWIWDFTLATVDSVIHQLLKLPTMDESIAISINVSAKVLQHEGFVDALLSKLAAASVGTKRITVELTETALISSPSQAREVLERLSEHGVGLAIDDFGAGFTSFNYLRQFPVQEIKLDKSYVMQLGEDRQFDESLVSCLSVFCEAMGLRLVAEGIESEAIYQKLIALGCDYGQGYGIARPMPVDQIPAWIHEWKSQGP
jgi:diguanylate cyclase (GGDEF)-like protein